MKHSGDPVRGWKLCAEASSIHCDRVRLRATGAGVESQAGKLKDSRVAILQGAVTECHTSKHVWKCCFQSSALPHSQNSSEPHTGITRQAKFGEELWICTCRVVSWHRSSGKVLGFKSELHAHFLIQGWKSCLTFLWLSFPSYGELAQRIN